MTAHFFWLLALGLRIGLARAKFQHRMRPQPTSQRILIANRLKVPGSGTIVNCVTRPPVSWPTRGKLPSPIGDQIRDTESPKVASASSASVQGPERQVMREGPETFRTSSSKVPKLGL